MRPPSPLSWIFGRGNVSAWADTTHEALRHAMRELLKPWRDANSGVFPSDVVRAMQFGDECFFLAGHVRAPAVNYPL